MKLEKIHKIKGLYSELRVAAVKHKTRPYIGLTDGEAVIIISSGQVEDLVGSLKEAEKELLKQVRS